MQKLKLDLLKIPEEKVFKGAKGEYIDLVLHENKNGKDQYGNDGFVAIDTTKDERAAGVKGAIIGNWRNIGGASAPGTATPYQRKSTPPAQKPKPAPDPDLDAPDGDDVPF